MPKKYPVKHERLNGKEDQSSRTLDTPFAPRINDHLVAHEDEERGGINFGEVIGIVTPDFNATEDKTTPEKASGDSFYIVRYPKTGEVGIATHDAETDEMKAGIILPVGITMYFGRHGDAAPDGETILPATNMRTERHVLGLAALSGTDSKRFGRGVSRIHGSLHLLDDGRLSISDGHEEVDPNTRIVQDLGSLNSTRVTTAHEAVGYQEDIVSKRAQQENERAAEKRLERIFSTPATLDSRGRSREQLMTEESIREAILTLPKVQDKIINSIIGKHLTPEVNSYENLVGFIRENSALRLELGKYLMQKVHEHRSIMPARLQQSHGEKSPSHPGYDDKLGNDEYAALLAISMLDGTFISKRSLSDPVEFVDRRNDTAINGGQHRLAAVQLLNLTPQAPQHIKITRTYANN